MTFMWPLGASTGSSCSFGETVLLVYCLLWNILNACVFKISIFLFSFIVRRPSVLLVAHCLTGDACHCLGVGETWKSHPFLCPLSARRIAAWLFWNRVTSLSFQGQLWGYTTLFSLARLRQSWLEQKLHFPPLCIEISACCLSSQCAFLFDRESEDTALLLLKEIYRTMNVSPEQPQHWLDLTFTLWVYRYCVYQCWMFQSEVFYGVDVHHYFLFFCFLRVFFFLYLKVQSRYSKGRELVCSLHFWHVMIF